ncbi:MAG: hypothetical protein Fur0025_00580 [Oscillatoriaceae cyanobacterium]
MNSGMNSEHQSEHIFQLIDSVLPFEVCLYHEVLPLSIQGSRLHLGMVDPKDAAALEYVRRILGYINCSLVPKRLEPETHKSILSAYLNYSQSRNPKPTVGRPPAEEPSGLHSTQLSGSTKYLYSEASSLVPPPVPSLPPGNQETHHQAGDWVPEILGSQETSRPISPPPPALEEGATRIQTNEIAWEDLPVLQVGVSHPDSPLTEIANLPPKQLLQELLGRVVMGGIGRLYFERQPEQGRILWSRDGVVQSVLEQLPLPVFAGVILALKQLSNVPLFPPGQIQQVEIPGRYEQEDLLLRLRIMPGNNGEEATLQVLRGAALKFYQKQRLVAIGRDALRLAQQLHHKVNELELCVRNHPALKTEKLESLPELQDLLHQVGDHLEAIAALEKTNQQETR